MELFMSAVVSQVFVNVFLLCSGGFIVEQLDPMDMLYIWIYDFAWLVIIDLVKMSIIRIQDGPIVGVNETTSRNFNSRSRSTSKSVSKVAARARPPCPRTCACRSTAPPCR